MLFLGGDKDTICALSSAPGHGGISVVRISGRLSVAAVRRLSGALPETPESHRIYVGHLHRAGSDLPFDHAVFSYFAEGRSFTGDETIEISTHGSPVVVDILLSELIKVGCRLAKPGEFTYRAFMNGRIDLVQAEGILGLIESRSKLAASAAASQVHGRLSQTYREIEDTVVWSLAQIEAGIDFSTEDLDVVSSEEISQKLDSISVKCAHLIRSYDRGRLLTSGLKLALVGQPNAGKSSLFNRLLDDNRAIVTEFPGTTRDVLRAHLDLHGVQVELADTAGLRSTVDPVEKIGIERAHQTIANADILLWVRDSSVSENWTLEKDLEFIESQKSDPAEVWLVWNKADRQTYRPPQKPRGVSQQFEISALRGDGIEKLESAIRTLVDQSTNLDSGVITSARQVEGLQKVQQSVQAARQLLLDDSGLELIAFELQSGVQAIHELMGKELNEQVIDRIFKEFCLGK